jgi:nucleoside-diphosphate-sugar epimerase
MTTVFLAGAAGIVGRRLSLLLVQAGYAVHGTTRKPESADWLRSIGCVPVMVDVFDAASLEAAVMAARPEVVIHQLTDLAIYHDPATRDESLRRNAKIRVDGTRNLLSAAVAAGACRVIAQSIAFVYADQPRPRVESDPLDTTATGVRAVTVQGVLALEEAVLHASALDGIVLRYGLFYGSGAGADQPADDGLPHVHVDAAAQAALLAIEAGAPGIYNIADDSSYASSEKARRDLDWTPDFRIGRA